MDFKRVFSPPVFEDVNKARTAYLLNIIILSLLFTVPLLGASTLFFLPAGDPRTILLFILSIILMGIYVLMRFRYIRSASVLLVLVIWLTFTIVMYRLGGVRLPAFSFLILNVLIAWILLGWKAGSLVTGLTVITGIGLVYAESTGQIVYSTEIVLPIGALAAYTFVLIVTAVLLYLYSGQLDQALERSQQHERKLLVANRELEALSTSLEEQVAARTRRLEIIAAINERLTGILSLTELLQEMVDQVKGNFNYYHAHIYLLDNQRDKLVVAAGTGEPGAKMKAEGHNIPLDALTSLVARAARTGQIVSVDNVREADNWLPNPLLPDTYSEMAVPIMLEGQVVGVLDVQENKIAGLDEGDANLLRSLANQVAVAIRNARLFEEVEAALAETRTAQARYLERSWQQTRIASHRGRHHYARPGAPALAETAVIQARRAALTQAAPAVVALGANGSDGVGDTSMKSIVALVKLQDLAIGTVQLHPLAADRNWSEDDLAVVEAVVDELARAAESLRLYEETRERAGFESLVGEITQKLRQAPTLDSLAKTAAEALGSALGVSHSLIKVGVRPKSVQPARNGHQSGTTGQHCS